jgi:uncharacterized protein (TIGR03437 family)
MRIIYLFALLAAAANAQPVSPLNCVASAVPALVRLEGLAERIGDIVLNCTGGIPNGLVRGDLRVISFGGNITNKLNSNTNTLDAVLTVNTGSGEMSTGAVPQLRGNNQFDFAGMNFNLGPAGAANFRITNVRIVPPQSAEQPFQFALATNGPSAIRVDNSPLTVGIATRGLLASYSPAFICTVSPIPSEPTFTNLLTSGTRFASFRFTEGFGESFIKRTPLADHGTRLLVRFSGFPAGARLLIPDALAGSNAIVPTAAGDLGLAPNGGRYIVNSGQLFLSRVRNPDANGAGGTPALDPATPSGQVIEPSGVSEVLLSNGAGIAVYEVADSNPSARESVQLPVFLGLEQRPTGGSVSAGVTASFGPISTDAMPSASPVPRFQPINPPSDCQTLGDCNSGIFPKLGVESESLVFNPIIGEFAQTRYIQIRNSGGGLLNWAASIQYKTGSGWLTADPSSGIGNGTIRLDASASRLAVGTYEAAITIDAGPIAGSVTAPIRLEARQIGPTPTLPPEITSIAHAATFDRGSLAPGTIATAFGNRFKGDNVQLQVSGVPARIFFANDTQINFEVPPGLPTAGTVSAFATVDARNSPTRSLTLVPASPGIFPGAVLNQDNTVNTAANPAAAGSIVQVFVTGLPAAGAPITVKIHDYVVTPNFASTAPGFIGLQQVNAQVPSMLQSISSELAVCWGTACSPTRPITIRQP